MDNRPKTAEAYVELVEQALFEVDELRMSAEYDMDSLGEAMGFLDPLEAGIKKLRASMADGGYRFADEDLPRDRFGSRRAQKCVIVPGRHVDHAGGPLRC